MRLFLLSLIALICISVTPIYAQDTIPIDREIARLGRGTANTLDWRPDGEVLAVGSSTGIWLFDRNFTILAHLYESAEGIVMDVVWSPDGTLLLGTYTNGIVGNFTKIWHVPKDARERSLIIFRRSNIGFVAWHPDGDLFSGNYIVDITTNEAYTVYEVGIQYASWMEIAETRPGGRLWWSPDGSRFVGTSRSYPSSSAIYGVFDAQTNALIFEFEDSIDGGSQFQWSSDGTRITNGGVIWDATTGEVIVAMYLVGPISNTFLWDEENGRMISKVDPLGLVMTEVSVWDTETGSEIIRHEFHNRFTDIDWYPNSDAIITATTEQGYMIYVNIFSGIVIESYHVFSQIFGTTWSPNSTQIATTNGATHNYPIQIWDVGSSNIYEYEPTSRLNDDIYPFGSEDVEYEWTGATIHWNDMDTITTVSDNFPIFRELFIIEQWNLETGESEGILFQRELEDDRLMPLFVPNPELTRVAVFSWFRDEDNYVEVIDLPNEELQFRLDTPSIETVYWSPDSNNLVTQNWLLTQESWASHLWHAQTGELIRTLDNYFIRWSSDSTFYVAEEIGKNNRRVAFLVQNAQTDEIHLRYDYSRLEHLCWLVWSPDGNVLVGLMQTVNEDFDELIMWNVNNGTIVESRHVQADTFISASWSPDGTMLALSHRDGTIRIWDVSDLVGNDG